MGSESERAYSFSLAAANSGSPSGSSSSDHKTRWIVIAALCVVVVGIGGMVFMYAKRYRTDQAKRLSQQFQDAGLNVTLIDGDVENDYPPIQAQTNANLTQRSAAAPMKVPSE